jgi:inner membrane protein
MTDAAAPPPAPPFPAADGPNPFRVVYGYLSGRSLLARALLLALLTLALKIPLGLVGGVISDRQRYESEAAGNIAGAWGGAQTFVGPMIVLPYRPRPGTGRAR